MYKVAKHFSCVIALSDHYTGVMDNVDTKMWKNQPSLRDGGAGGCH